MRYINDGRTITDWIKIIASSEQYNPDMFVAALIEFLNEIESRFEGYNDYKTDNIMASFNDDKWKFHVVDIGGFRPDSYSATSIPWNYKYENLGVTKSSVPSDAPYGNGKDDMVVSGTHDDAKEWYKRQFLIKIKNQVGSTIEIKRSGNALVNKLESVSKTGIERGGDARTRGWLHVAIVTALLTTFVTGCVPR